MPRTFTLYLIGYGNQIPDQLFERLEQVVDTALIVDIRARRQSWAWSWSGPQVEFIVKKRGHDYIWLHQLGNLNRNGQVRLANEAVGMMALESQIRTSSLPIVLLCAERLGTDCHRSVVADKLRDRLKAVGDCLEVRPL
jgi:uncharacterized protein (DUF488 family)